MRHFEQIERTVDQDGVCIDEKTKIINLRPFEQEPEYIKLYIEDLGRLNSLTPACTEILLYVAANVDYDGFVSLTTHRLARISLTCGCAPKTIRNAISEFVKSGLLLRVGRAEYELNPSFFAKGKWRKIRERRLAFNLRLGYSEKQGRTMVSALHGEQLDFFEPPINPARPGA